MIYKMTRATDLQMNLYLIAFSAAFELKSRSNLYIILQENNRTSESITTQLALQTHGISNTKYNKVS